MQVSLPVTAQNICDLFVTGVEGGCNYWCERMEFTKNGEPASYQEEATFADDDWSIKVQAEDYEGATITPATLAAALAVRATEAAQLVTDDGSFDAGSADAIIQQAAYGEIVFG